MLAKLGDSSAFAGISRRCWSSSSCGCCCGCRASLPALEIHSCSAVRHNAKRFRSTRRPGFPGASGMRTRCHWTLSGVASVSAVPQVSSLTMLVAGTANHHGCLSASSSAARWNRCCGLGRDTTCSSSGGRALKDALLHVTNSASPMSSTNTTNEKCCLCASLSRTRSRSCRWKGCRARGGDHPDGATSLDTTNSHALVDVTSSTRTGCTIDTAHSERLASAHDFSARTFRGFRGSGRSSGASSKTTPSKTSSHIQATAPCFGSSSATDNPTLSLTASSRAAERCRCWKRPVCGPHPACRCRGPATTSGPSLSPLFDLWCSRRSSWSKSSSSHGWWNFSSGKSETPHPCSWPSSTLSRTKPRC